MPYEEQLPPSLQDALRQGLLRKLPITFRPFTQQQLNDWEHLFPYERQAVLRVLLHLASLREEQFTELFRDVIQIEEKMGVRHWQFSTEEQTILNASLLARSPYYQEWRQAVERVFVTIEQHAPKTEDERHRLILLLLPQQLPLDRSRIWQRWQAAGRPVQLDLTFTGDVHGAGEALIAGLPDGSKGLLKILARRPDRRFADSWVIDAGGSLVDGLLKSKPSAGAAEPAVLLSNQRLAMFRESFSREVNTIRKDLADADSVYARLRKADVTDWCPDEVASEPVVREFLRALYLSGNGALIFGNSFAEWGAVEAFRRARPAFLAAQFGVRSKPKPFTSVAVFENPDKINPLPAVDDLPGSALDAEILARYVWLAASRYDEYQRRTVCVCVAESISQAYLIAPPEFSLGQSEPIKLERLRAELSSWLA